MNTHTTQTACRYVYASSRMYFSYEGLRRRDVLVRFGSEDVFVDPTDLLRWAVVSFVFGKATSSTTSKNVVFDAFEPVVFGVVFDAFEPVVFDAFEPVVLDAFEPVVLDAFVMFVDGTPDTQAQIVTLFSENTREHIHDVFDRCKDVLTNAKHFLPDDTFVL